MHNLEEFLQVDSRSVHVVVECPGEMVDEVLDDLIVDDQFPKSISSIDIFLAT